MKTLLTDAQIEKAYKILRESIKAMLDGKSAINPRDYVRSGKTKGMLMYGSVTVRHTLRIIEDLLYYKSQVEELQNELVAAKAEIDYWRPRLQKEAKQ